MKICLVIPPSVFLLDERVFMSLGILRVAAVLEQAGHSVEVLDLSGIENYEVAVSDYCSSCEDVPIFGITSTTPQLPAAVKIAQAIHAGFSVQVRVILGGPHITLINAAAKRGIERAGVALRSLFEYFNVLVAGDGERAIFDALTTDLGLVDADDIKSLLFLNNKTLSDLPLPARHLLDVDSYHYTIEGVRATSLIAQLGCPFECGFCGGRMSPMLRKIRMRTVDSILEEILHLHTQYGFQGFMFYDDEMNVNKGMIELMNAIARKGLDLGVEWRLRGFVKAELFTDEQAEAMYRAGFRWVLTGFESGSPRVLKNMNKKATREDNTRAVEIAHRNGLKVKALMSLGHPGESPVTVEETKNWLLEVKPDDFDLTVITLYPGTPYYDYSKPSEKNDVWCYETNGDKLHSFDVDHTRVADYYKGDPNDGYISYVFTDELSPKDLVALRNAAEDEVRHKLLIPYNQSAAAQRYEHSMGQLPSRILMRRT